MPIFLLAAGALLGAAAGGTLGYVGAGVTGAVVGAGVGAFAGMVGFGAAAYGWGRPVYLHPVPYAYSYNAFMGPPLYPMPRLYCTPAF